MLGLNDGFLVGVKMAKDGRFGECVFQLLETRVPAAPSIRFGHVSLRCAWSRLLALSIGRSLVGMVGVSLPEPC
jgi:hypothetical protein